MGEAAQEWQASPAYAAPPQAWLQPARHTCSAWIKSLQSFVTHHALSIGQDLRRTLHQAVMQENISKFDPQCAGCLADRCGHCLCANINLFSEACKPTELNQAKISAEPTKTGVQCRHPGALHGCLGLQLLPDKSALFWMYACCSEPTAATSLTSAPCSGPAECLDAMLDALWLDQSRTWIRNSSSWP